MLCVDIGHFYNFFSSARSVPREAIMEENMIVFGFCPNGLNPLPPCIFGGQRETFQSIGPLGRCFL